MSLGASNYRLNVSQTYCKGSLTRSTIAKATEVTIPATFDKDRWAAHGALRLKAAFRHQSQKTLKSMKLALLLCLFVLQALYVDLCVIILAPLDMLGRKRIPEAPNR